MARRATPITTAWVLTSRSRLVPQPQRLHTNARGALERMAGAGGAPTRSSIESNYIPCDQVPALVPHVQSSLRLRLRGPTWTSASKRAFVHSGTFRFVHPAGHATPVGDAEPPAGWLCRFLRPTAAHRHRVELSRRSQHGSLRLSLRHATTIPASGLLVDPLVQGIDPAHDFSLPLTGRAWGAENRSGRRIAGAFHFGNDPRALALRHRDLSILNHPARRFQLAMSDVAAARHPTGKGGLS